MLVNDVIWATAKNTVGILKPGWSLEKSSVNMQRNSCFGDGYSLKINIQEDGHELSQLKNSSTDLLAGSMYEDT